MESVLAATVLALVASVLLSLLPSTLLSVRRSDRQLQAGALAQSLLETQKLAYFPDLASQPNLPAGRTADGTELKPSLDVTAGPEPGSKRVRVTVRWQEASRDYSVFRETVLARLPR